MKNIQSKKLANGLEVIYAPRDHTNSVTVMVFTRVGSRYENKPINGASHFIEHLMFKGTERRPTTLDISKELDRYGAEYNAFTGKDATAYYVKIDAEHSGLAVDLLHDMLTASKFDATEIDRERGVIVEEINMYEDNPRMHIEDLLEEVLFPDSTLGWNIAGPKEVIRNVPREDLIQYRDAYYIPERMSVVAAGAVDDTLEAEIESRFGGIKPPDEKRDEDFAPFTPPDSLKEPLALQTKNTEQVQLGMAFHGYSMSDKERPAANLLATILGGSMSSRLFIQVRERKGLCYSISASHQSLDDTGVFTIMSGLEKTRLKEAVEIIWEELQKTVNAPVEEEELQRAKDYISGKTVLSMEDSSNEANWYGKLWLYKQKLQSPEERLQEIQSITTEDIQRVAKKLFDPKHMAASVIGPFENKDELRAIFPF